MSDNNQQVSSLLFFHFDSFRSKIWAFTMMNSAHKMLKNTPGLQFYKLLGSGKGRGFNPFPDWSTYALLLIWDNRAFAQKFAKDSALIDAYKSRCSKIVNHELICIRSQGQWSGKNPFSVYDVDYKDSKLAVITRATIKPSKLMRFWKYVPTSSRPIAKAEGLLYTKGIGEVPLMQMATFSLWESEEDIKKYAYKSKEHMKAIKLTRELGWYREELFARFKLLLREEIPVKAEND